MTGPKGLKLVTASGNIKAHIGPTYIYLIISHTPHSPYTYTQTKYKQNGDTDNIVDF